MKNSFHYLLVFVALGFLSLTSCKQNAPEKPEIRGVYGNPQSLWEKAGNLSELGVNAVFVRHHSIDQAMMDRARSEGIKVYAEFATLNGKNYVEDHPEAWAVNDQGEKVEAAGWFMGVCPTDPDFRQYRFDQLRDLLTEYDLDGVWMDYVHWHAQFEEPEPILPETCFCDNCLNNFSKDTEIDIPEGTTTEKAQWILENREQSWRDWRCRVIKDWTVVFKNIINEHQPGALLGLYHSPWNDTEYNGARRRILGLDYDMLKETVDVFSPMVYHERMGRDPEWVEENINWFSGRLDTQKDTFPKIWPIVQATDVSPEAFETVLRGGLAGKSGGVMMFTSNAIADNKAKMQVMKNMYIQLMGNADN